MNSLKPINNYKNSAVTYHKKTASSHVYTRIRISVTKSFGKTKWGEIGKTKFQKVKARIGKPRRKTYFKTVSSKNVIIL